MPNRNGRPRGSAAPASAPGPTALDAYENWRRYETVRLAPPYAEGELKFYVNLSRAEVTALEGKSADELLVFVLRGWNLTDPQGMLLPIEPATFERLPLPLLTAIWTKWAEVRDAAANLLLPVNSPATTDAAPSPTAAETADSSLSSPALTSSPATTAPSPGT